MSTTDQLSFTVHDDVPSTDGGVVDAGLDASNLASAPLRDVRSLSCFARGPDDRIVGGAIGRTWGECCELQQLWVDPPHRRHGVGTRLVQAFERRASERGCRTVYLETFSFQAPAMYESLGYETKLDIRGFPGGIVKHIMVREIGPDEAEA